MKNPKKFPWKNHLPEHFPSENLWEKIMAKKSLGGQIRILKSQLPQSYPKEDLWIDIENSLNERKTIVLWSRVISIASVLLVGLWGVAELSNNSVPEVTINLTTEISKDTKESIAEVYPIAIPKPKEDKKPATSNLNLTVQIKPFDKQIIPKPEFTDPLKVGIPLPEIFFAEVDGRTKNSEVFSDTTYKGKKTIAITWDEQPKRIILEGFHIELTDNERQVLNELEKRKKGKFTVDVNAVTARLYEK